MAKQRGVPARSEVGHDPARMVGAIEAWYARAARELPWRDVPAGERDPYRVLVAEAMLQQTQVSRVVPKYVEFVEQFPTVAALAAADEREVLALWSGLGYYRRARSLHAAARVVVERFGGRVPRGVDELMELPGVGRYTAGAVASIAMGERVPIVDGNVARVLLRVHGVEAATNAVNVQPWLWARARELVEASVRAGALNEGLMELGATVCVPPPAEPGCLVCPLREMCIARERGLVGRIPTAKAAVEKRELYCAAVVVRDGAGRVLLEERPRQGMWGGLWQALTIEREDRFATVAELRAAVGIKGLRVTEQGEFAHATTHRDVRFRVYVANLKAKAPLAGRGEWVCSEELSRRGLSNAQRRVLEFAGKSVVTGRERPARTRTTG